MTIRERRIKMLKTVTCGELVFRAGQSVLVPVKLADLWIRDGLAEKVSSFDDLRAEIREQRKG